MRLRVDHTTRISHIVHWRMVEITLLLPEDCLEVISEIQAAQWPTRTRTSTAARAPTVVRGTQITTVVIQSPMDGQE